MKIVKSTSLYFREGSSDKVYLLDLVEDENGFLVNFRFGKRGTSLQKGTKTTVAVPLNKAEDIYTKLIKEKTSKGYTFDETGVPFSNEESKDRTDYLPQLLNIIDEIKLEDCLNNDDYITQPKIDGVRMIIHIQGNQVKAYNRNGIKVPGPKNVMDELSKLDIEAVFDGELVKDKYYIFDLLNLNGDMRNKACFERLTTLYGLGSKNIHTSCQFVPTAYTEPEKRKMFETLKSKNEEGIVIKLKNSRYVSGRPNSLGEQLKFKFITSASVIVTGVNSQRSVAIGVLSNGNMTPIGNVKIPPNEEIPQIDSIIEVQYLYAFKDTNSLFQPVYLGSRSDIQLDDCDIDQLKYKND